MFDSFVGYYIVIKSFEAAMKFLTKWYTINTIQISYETAVLKKTSSILDDPDSQQR